MLVLKRNRDQSVIIGCGKEAVRIMVVDAGPGWARLGIEAPDNIEVDRYEIREAKERDGRHGHHARFNYPQSKRQASIGDEGPLYGYEEV